MLEKIGLPAKPALRGNNWVVDATHCQGCSSQFTFINRKHHCRRCGGLFCNSCTLQRMVLRGQGDSPVRICEPCKKLEEAARFELRHGHRNRTGRGSSKLTSKNEDDILNEILGDTSSTVCRLQKDASSASSSSLQKINSLDEGEDGNSLSSLESSQSSSPEELRQQALEEKNKYKILKAGGKSEEALRAFKRGKELERQAAALELLLRKNRKKALLSSKTIESQESNDERTNSSRKYKLSPQDSKEKDDLSSELRELGWSDKDLHEGDKKHASMSLESELCTLLEVSQKTDTGKGNCGIDKTQVLAHKKKALSLKREGKLAEAKEELKRAKILEKKLEEEAFLAEAEDSDDELSALIRSIDSDDQDDLLGTYKPGAHFSFDHLMGMTDDFGVDGNFEATEEDMDDPELAIALKSLGWTDEANHIEDVDPQIAAVEREALLREIQSLKTEALNQKKVGNTTEALQLLRKAKMLEKDLGSHVMDESSIPRSAESQLRPNEADFESVNRMGKPDLTSPLKSRQMIQKELLSLKKRALALRREGKLDEADEELKKGKVLEQQLEVMDNASKVKNTQVNVGNKQSLNFKLPDVDDEQGDVTDQDLHDPTYLALLKNLGWKEEDEKSVVVQSKPTEQSGGGSMQISDYSGAQVASSVQIGAAKRSKGEIQRELLGLKRKALTLRRQGETDEAEEVLNMAKVLEAKLAEMEKPKEEAQSATSRPVETLSISSLHKKAVEDVDETNVSEEDMHDPALLSVLKNLGWKDEVDPATSMQKSSERVASVSANTNIVTEDPGNTEKITYEKREEKVVKKKNEFNSVQETVSQNGQPTVRQEILILKRKAVALKKEGKLAEAKEELRQAKLLEKSLEDDNAHPGTSSDSIPSPTSNVTTSPGQKVEHGSPNMTSKPLSGRDRFKLQQESLSHKRLALKLRREGRTEEAEAELQLAKALETQLEVSSTNDSVKSNPVDDVGVEDFLDPQLLSALKAIGFEDASTVPPAYEKPEPIKSVNAGRGENTSQERRQLEEQVKAEKLKALNLKRSGKQSEALDALRRAKALEKRLNSLAS
ncbi:hypothetical protein NMG60_11004586 [Bertholletia excelsa]